eukprot:3229478-Rhodomonas_salina.1
MGQGYGWNPDDRCGGVRMLPLAQTFAGRLHGSNSFPGYEENLYPGTPGTSQRLHAPQLTSDATTGYPGRGNLPA